MAPDIIIACVIGATVSTAIVAIRIWTRLVVTKNFGLDDYAALVTLPFCIGFSVVLGLSTRFGMGLHGWNWIFICSALYLPSILGYRLALLLLYLRVFGSNRPFRYATYGVLAFVTAYLTANIMSLIFGCTPITKYWRSDEPGHCLHLTNADYAYGSMNVASDVMMFLLPLPMVWKLDLSRRDKVGLVMVFMSGILNCVVTTARFGLLVENLNAPDTAWLDARTFLLTVVEVNTGLICGCTPVLKSFFRHVMGRSQTRSHQQPSMGRPGDIWMGKYPDDQTKCNYREYVELEHQKGPVGRVSIQETRIKEDMEV